MIISFFIMEFLSQVIFEIMDKYLGEHEVTVEFTDSKGKSNTFKERIIVE